MIIGNNNGNNFNNKNSCRGLNNTSTSPSNNNFQNRWNTIQENQNQHPRSNGFIKNIQDQKYASSTDTHGMQDRTLAMLHERLKKGTISLEEFNKKCAQLGQQRQNMAKNNKLF